MMYHLKRWQKRDVDKSVEGWIVICRKIIDIEEDMFFFIFNIKMIPTMVIKESFLGS